jgi:AbrB family looped-hinge helix DNA binding protein
MQSIALQKSVILQEKAMAATLTSKNQVTIPKQIRSALGLEPGSAVEFAVNQAGEVVIHKACACAEGMQDRFDRVRGKADIAWRTEELMRSLRT